jgi:1-acyl-sn-glycerol-3-phosphate acyltransferase
VAHNAPFLSHQLTQRPDLIAVAGNRLSGTERRGISLVRRTLEPGLLDGALRWCQRTIGATWIHHCTKHLRHVRGLERIPPLAPEQSFLCVSNHRSFFDLYVITGHLVRLGMPHRIVFPVRSRFFYDSVLGHFVNGVMSFFAMYPPIYRERSRLELNRASLQELIWLLRRGGTFAGFHPEGRRNPHPDPYTLLPAQRGVGQVIHQAQVPVLPVFINGLVNDLRRQVWSNFDGTGTPVIVVFGAPIDFSDQYDRPASPTVHREIAARTLQTVAQLGQEEKRLRAQLAEAASSQAAGA